MYFDNDYVDYDKRNISKLKAICTEECPLVAECAEYAIHHEAHGIWGGLTVRDRAAIRRQRGIVLTEPNDALIVTRHKGVT